MKLYESQEELDTVIAAAVSAWTFGFVFGLGNCK